MIKLENFEVVGWEHAIRGMRNPMNSWEKGDSDFSGDVGCGHTCNGCPNVDDCGGHGLGSNDHALMMKLRNAGTDHRKFMRMITVYVDIMAPLYWWKEFDTYKVGTVANSCSTMHKIHEKGFTLEDFSHEHLINQNIHLLEKIVDALNVHRAVYLTTNTEPTSNHTQLSDKACTKIKKDIWWQMIQLLPSSYNQKRTVMLNYEVLANIYKSRKKHKLEEWCTFCNWIEELPDSDIITGAEAAYEKK